jgi:2-keto-4-pentenoate hydratase
MPLDHWETSRVLAVRVNGEAIESGDLWAMTGGAAEAVDWLRGDLARHGVSLVPGDLVLTGTHLGLHPVRPGDRVAVSVDGREFVACRIA